VAPQDARHKQLPPLAGQAPRPVVAALQPLAVLIRLQRAQYRSAAQEQEESNLKHIDRHPSSSAAHQHKVFPPKAPLVDSELATLAANQLVHRVHIPTRDDPQPLTLTHSPQAGALLGCSRAPVPARSATARKIGMACQAIRKPIQHRQRKRKSLCSNHASAHSRAHRGGRQMQSTRLSHRPRRSRCCCDGRLMMSQQGR